MAFKEEWAKSKAYVSGLDRTRLGRLAIPERILIYVDVVERSYVNGIYLDDDGVAPDELGASISLQKMIFDAGLESYEVYAELYYWWSKAPKRKGYYAKVRLGRWNGKRMQSSKERIEKTVEHPELHDYFAVGICNIEKATHYLSNGIDAELAVRL